MAIRIGNIEFIKWKKNNKFQRDRFTKNFNSVYISVGFIIIFNISARSFQFIKWKKNNKYFKKAIDK